MIKKPLLITISVLIATAVVFQLIQKDICLVGAEWDLCDTRMENRDRIENLLENTLKPDQNGEVLVTGTVTNRGGTQSPCEQGDTNCNFLLMVQEVTVPVYPNYSPTKPCVNNEVAQAVKQIYNADTVVVYGRYNAGFGITTCESDNFYIRKMP